MRRIFSSVVFKIESSRQRLTTWFGLILTLAGATLTATLSTNAFSLATAGTVGEIKLANLSAPATVDAAARQKYLNERRAAELARQQAALEPAQINAAETERAASASRTPAAARSVPAQSNYDRLIIPRIGLNARLATVGLTSSGAVDVHPSLPGRWSGSARPGSSGAVFVGGHSTGIFKALGRLAVGDQISIALASGETYNYTVAKIETRSLNDPALMRDALAAAGGATQGLNLMTCAGSPMGNTYSHRLIVYATR